MERVTSDADRSAELPLLILFAAESEDGQDAQVRADLQKFLATPRTFHTIADIQHSGLLHYATLRQLLEGLRHAGMPEEKRRREHRLRVEPGHSSGLRY